MGPGEPGYFILPTPAKANIMMSTILSVFNGEVIESRVDVPATFHSPFQEKRASSSANQIITSPLAPITPVKGLNMVVDVPVALLSPFTERTASSSTNLILTSPLAPITLDKGSNPVAPLLPGMDKTPQNCQLHETTKLPGERLADGNIEKNCMTKKAPFQHAKSSFEGVCPPCLESARGEVEDEETQGIDLNKTPRKKAEMRKKHRPKVIQEGKPIKSPSPVIPKAAECKERPTPKRTYVRKKKILNSSVTPICITEENKVKWIPMKMYVRKRKALNSSESLSGRLGETKGLCSSTAVKTVNQLAISASKSVRRRLDFSAEGESADGCHVSTASDVRVAAGESFNGNSIVGIREFTQGLNAVMTKLPAEVIFDLNRSPNHVLDENPTPSAQLSGTDIVRKHEGGSDSSVAENEMIMQSDQVQFEPGSHSDIVTRDDDIEKTGTKRAHDQIDQHYSAKEFPRDAHFVHGYNETNKTSSYQETSGLIPYLPVVYKRRRTERGQTWRCNRAFLPKLSRCFTIADAQWLATFARLQQSELMLAFDLTQRVTRKRSKLHTRARKPTPIAGAEDCSHLLWSPERTEGSHVMPENNKYEPQTCMDALFADTRFKITTKKRRKKGYVHLVSSMLSDMEEECEVASSRFGFRGQPFVPQAVVPYMDPMDVLLDKMKHMKIGGEHIKAIAEASNALIPYGKGSTMIPYGLLFDTIKKQRPRAKVDLDPETNRVWNLLMGGKRHDKADGVDMDKEKWWEEERHVFQGRTDAFIARMHLIQGDRRFSKWNGSIVDSVVGAFLTQNVSDHLSSSAFMSLAARFPLKSRGNSMEENAEKMDTSKEQGDGSIPGFGVSCQEMMSIPETIDPGSTGTYKEEKVPYDVSSSIESISHVPSLVYDDQLVEVLPKEIDIDFSAENTHKEVEILTETQHCGNQTEYPSSCTDFKFNLKKDVCSPENEQPEKKKGVSRAKTVNFETKKMFDWEGLREEAFTNGAKIERSSDTMDSLDWEQVRNAEVNEISKAIRGRGMNNVLAERIKDFLNRLVKDHGSIDLEWLRNVPPDKAKEYLLSIRGLGLKSVECVRLLTLHHLAFPVDTNVGRVCVRLGWVPLQPLPESLQLHLLELYPMIQHIQKYLWPRLCTLDQQTLYELHYQMITFGKVFCTKTKPNCNACPMRGECKHFASAFASARLSLPAPEESRLVASRIASTLEKERSRDFTSISLPQLEGRQLAKGSISNDCKPIIEEPATPEQECIQNLERDIEDAFYEDPEEIPTIKLNSEEFVKNLENYMQENQVEMQDGDISNALVTITADTASLPMPKLKNMSRLRTEHQVYELPDLHPLLEGMDQRVPSDPCPYLLAIWTAGETSQSIEPPQSCRRPQDSAILCDGKTCFACNSTREAQAQTVRGTILIPCRTAMRGSFPLNGTYFQVNEVFADHSSSRVPIDVPRKWIWNLPRRTVFFGTSVSTIFKGLTMEGIQQCFWRGFVCVRGFDRASKAPRPLYARLHFPPSKAVQNKKMPAKEE